MKLKILLLVILVPISIFFDLWTKEWATDTLKNKPSIEVVNCCFHLHYAENKGAAFSMLADSSEEFRGPFFKTIIVVFFAFGLPFYFKTPDDQKLTIIGMSLIFSGALGNFIDRINNGYVVDFIFWHYYRNNWPIFNIADTVISTGLGLIIIESIILSIRERRAQKESSAS